MSARSSTLAPTVNGTPEAIQSSSKEDIDPYLVTLEPEDDPKCMSTLRRWVAVVVISSAALCVACASSVVRVFRLLVWLVALADSVRLPLQKRGLLKHYMYRMRYRFLPSVSMSLGLVPVLSLSVPCPRCMVR